MDEKNSASASCSPSLSLRKIAASRYRSSSTRQSLNRHAAPACGHAAADQTAQPASHLTRPQKAVAYAGRTHQHTKKKQATMKQPSTKAEFDAVLAEAAAAGKAVVVDFTATWCGPCQRIAPLFAQLASEFPQAEFIKVDVDENQETAQACQVSAMPTFKVFRDKKEVGMIRGADPNGLRALIQQHAGDKWSVAGEGQSLGSAQDTGGMSEREKRLAALERRGL